MSLHDIRVTAVAFDVHLAEIFVPLAIGIPILTAPRSLLLEDLPYYITHLRVSHVGIVPSLIEATMGAVQEDEASGHSTNLRYIASGGEKMSDAVGLLIPPCQCKFSYPNCRSSTNGLRIRGSSWPISTGKLY